VPLLTTAIAIAVIRGAAGQAENDTLMAGRGKVSFVVSCDANLQPRFDAALAALHSFWYGQALNEFTAIHRSRSQLCDELLGDRNERVEPAVGAAAAR
jgi:hypothetical protein